MPRIYQGLSGDIIRAYDGFNTENVGLGLANPNAPDDRGAYASSAYRKTKIKSLAIGLVSEFVYSGFDHDPNPLAIPLFLEPAYNTLMSVNLNYLDRNLRKKVLKTVLEMNRARIKSNKPIMIDWHTLKKTVPEIQYTTRRYKVIGINPIETYPLVEWGNVADRTSRFDGFWRKVKAGQVK